MTDVDFKRLKKVLPRQFKKYFNALPPAPMDTEMGIAANTFIFTEAMELVRAGKMQPNLSGANLDIVLDSLGPRL